jgi:hypothetical protein
MPKIRLALLVGAIFLVMYPTLGQYRISGYIEEGATREKLYGATILIKGTSTGTTSNFYGYFSLPISQSSVDIVCSFVGYQSQNIHFELKKDTSIIVSLNSSEELDAVVVRGLREEAIELQPQVSSISLQSSQLLKLPAIAGEIDLMRALQLLPGVQSGSEGSTGLYVRGGGPDQNLILLDGVPLYSVSHLGGLFSVFNPDVISDVNLIKGGYPARYGGRLSSVINVRMKDGNRVERETTGAVGLLSARLTTEGPIKSGKGAYVVGLRRTYIDLLTRPISSAASKGAFNFGYLFYDFNGKANYDLGENDKLSISAYSGDDKAFLNFEDGGLEGKSVTKWGNSLTNVKWSHLISDNLFTNLTLNHTNYRFVLGFEQEAKKAGDDSFFFEYRSGIRDLSAKYEVEYFYSNAHEFVSGLHFTSHYFTPGVNAFKSNFDGEKSDTTFGSFNVKAREMSYYLEDQWEATDRLKFNLGIHFNGYSVENKIYASAQPRATVRFLTDKWSSVKLSYATMQQNVHLLSTSGVGLPSDLWVPATTKVAPQKSYQVTAAYDRTLPRGYEVSIEGYYKEMTHLIAYSNGENWLDGSEDWQERVELNGSGTSKGLEFFLHKKEGRFTGWVGYTLSKTDRHFANINNGGAYPYKYDRRHDVGILMSYKFNDRVEISGTWVYGTGNAITLGEGRYMAYSQYDWSMRLDDPRENYPSWNPEVEHYAGRNQFRMRSYHRSDLGIKFTKEKKWGERTWNWGFYNVYNRANPFYYYWADDSYSGARRLKQIALFPIIPSFSYEFRF